MSLPLPSITELINQISSFLNTPSCKPPLHSWLRLGGHINWAFNVLPWGRPALSEFYQKIGRKLYMNAGIFINAAVRHNLEWLCSILPSAIGIRFVDDGHWKDHNADMVFWTDASLTKGLAFVFASSGFVYPLQPPPPSISIDIFFLELIAMLSAIQYAVSLPSPPKKILIWSDTLNSLHTRNHMHTCVKRTYALTYFPDFSLTTFVANSQATTSASSIPKGSLASALERVLLKCLGGRSKPRVPQPIQSHKSIDERVEFLATNAIEATTLGAYGTGARDYVTFCIDHSISLEPTPQTLAHYITYTSQFVTSGPEYLTVAHHFLCDIYPDFVKNCSDPLVQATISGSKKIRADPVKQKLPLCLAHLQAFYDWYLKDPTYDNLLFITILSCISYGCHHAGELVVSNSKSSKSRLGYQKLVKRSSLSFCHHHVQYHLPYHKGDHFYWGSDILLSPKHVADPVSLLHSFVQQHDSLHGAKAPLFLRSDGSLPSRQWFKSIFSLLNQKYGGHSVRAGCATYYASLGLSETVIQVLGCWLSEAWKIYIWNHPTIHALRRN
ncbi:hypothetical protein D9758_017049 [Tetrapyrgos nigripes]|uniref:Uncharacterized protein n=1 Tax=Tetrapyrgos nigripes TaxID=182062 RepID=A0A8H5CJW6_9AGAR|nr:hypothetical protein D9758_017049 [Tetrapyrgos nigripes]